MTETTILADISWDTLPNRAQKYIVVTLSSGNKLIFLILLYGLFIPNTPLLPINVDNNGIIHVLNDA